MTDPEILDQIDRVLNDDRYPDRLRLWMIHEYLRQREDQNGPLVSDSK